MNFLITLDLKVARGKDKDFFVRLAEFFKTNQKIKFSLVFKGDISHNKWKQQICQVSNPGYPFHVSQMFIILKWMKIRFVFCLCYKQFHKTLMFLFPNG